MPKINPYYRYAQFAASRSRCGPGSLTERIAYGPALVTESTRTVMFDHLFPSAGPTELSALLAVFLFGLLGSTHCVGMCGGIVATLSRQPRTIPLRVEPREPEAFAGHPSPIPGPDPTGRPNEAAARHTPGHPGPGSANGQTLTRQLAYNGGRLASYALAGLLAGATGSAAALAEHLLPIQQFAFVAGSLVMMVIGLQMIGVPAVSSVMEGAGRVIWPFVQPLAQSTLRLQGLRGAFAAGLAWGWVPCAMVYGVLALAIVSGNPLSGAMIMLVFGLGTAPALIGLGWVSARGSSRFDTPRLRRTIGFAIVIFALAGLARLDPIGRIHQFGELCLSWIR
jgi:sulfite exporter TauE/SafE